MLKNEPIFLVSNDSFVILEGNRIKEANNKCEGMTKLEKVPGILIDKSDDPCWLYWIMTMVNIPKLNFQKRERYRVKRERITEISGIDIWRARIEMWKE